MNQEEEKDIGPIGSNDPMPSHVMPRDTWERLKAEMEAKQK
jgi:hypothetical protein